MAGGLSGSAAFCFHQQLYRAAVVIAHASQDLNDGSVESDPHLPAADSAVAGQFVQSFQADTQHCRSAFFTPPHDAVWRQQNTVRLLPTTSPLTTASRNRNPGTVLAGISSAASIVIGKYAGTMDGVAAERTLPGQ
jgi:hypothetical protein